MNSKLSNIGAEAFGPQAKSVTVVRYESNVTATNALLKVLDDVSGIGVLHGPAGSGKSVIVNQLVKRLRRRTVVLALDGISMTARQIVLALLEELGCNVRLESMRELLDLAHVIGVHSVRTSSPPILFVENIDRMSPSGLQALCVLASFTTDDRSAVRLILTGRDDCIGVLQSQEMSNIAMQASCIVALGPMTLSEAVNYLHAKLVRVGVDRPDEILPLDVCEDLFEQSAGWPLRLNLCAQRLIESTAEVQTRGPELVVSKSGRTVAQEQISSKKTLLGRSPLADVQLDEDYVSKFHAIFLQNGDGIMIVDLNSNNGTYVNSKRVASATLRSNDIVSIGHYRIKVLNVARSADDPGNQASPSDTAKMKSLADQRALREEATMPNLVEEEKKA